jgi:hypothetical protein
LLARADDPDPITVLEKVVRGLIGASLLTPCYDITFSMAAEPYKRRRKGDLYRDLRLSPIVAKEPIVFLGGKDYVPLFCELTKEVKGGRTVFYNSGRRLFT